MEGSPGWRRPADPARPASQAPPAAAPSESVSIYTLVQLFEVVLFGAVLGYGILEHRPSLALLGGGLLIGKAILNILAPEGGTVLRRSLAAYAMGGVYSAIGILLVHFFS